MEQPIRDLYLTGIIEDDKPFDIIQQINLINIADKLIAEPEPINLWLCTEGGCITTGLALCDAIRLSKTPINVIAFGRCYSIGISILASGHIKSATKSTTFMIHQGSGCLEGNIEYMKTEIEYIKSLDKLADDIILSGSKIKQKELDAIYEKSKEYNFGCSKAKKWGLVDTIL